MASIDKRGKAYRIRVCNGYDSNGKKIVRTAIFYPEYTTQTGKKKADSVIQREVEKYAANFEKTVKEGSILITGNMKFSALAEKFLSEHAFVKLSPATAEGYQDVLQNKILPVFGHYKIQDLCRQKLEIQKFYNEMAKPRKDYDPLAPSTIRRYIGIFSSVMSWAVKMGLAESNPLEQIEVPGAGFKKEKLKSFTIEEVKRFLIALEMPLVTVYKAHTVKKSDGSVYEVPEFIETRTIPEQLKLFFIIAVFSGCRRGEILALNWEDFNFDACTISITKSASKTKNGVIIKAPKTASGVRVIYLPDFVMELAKRWQIHQREKKLQLGSAWKGNDNVFCQADGSLMYPDTVSAKFKDIIRNYNAQCAPEDRLPEISLHGLRHTAASILINQHTDVATVSSRLGHSRKSVTLDIYTHKIKEADKEAAEVLGKLLNLDINAFASKL